LACNAPSFGLAISISSPLYSPFRTAAGSPMVLTGVCLVESMPPPLRVLNAYSSFPGVSYFFCATFSGCCDYRLPAGPHNWPQSPPIYSISSPFCSREKQILFRQISPLNIGVHPSAVPLFFSGFSSLGWRWPIFLPPYFTLFRRFYLVLIFRM